MDKATSLKTQQVLYESIYRLTLVYPTSNDFKDVFKPDMFAKKNKAAFHHVVHFLLKTLNPDVIKKKLPSWMPYDAKTETLFRHELLKYVNELNTIYEYADIPVMMQSHLISPGGEKIVRFMLKLSQLVLYEHVVKADGYRHVVMPPSVAKNKKAIAQLKDVTRALNEECRSTMDEFRTTHARFRVEADDGLRRINELSVEIAALRERLANCRKTDRVDVDLDEFSVRVERLEAMMREFVAGCELAEDLSEQRTSLRYKPGDLKVPTEVRRLVNPNANSLNLLKYLEATAALIDKKMFDVRLVSADDLESYREEKENVNRNLEDVLGNLEFLKEQYVGLQVLLKEALGKNCSK